MENDLQPNWELSGIGWATWRIKDGSAEWEESVSYCTDALSDLLHGVAGLYGTLAVQRFSFDLEPAEARWVPRSRGVEVDVAIYRFSDMSASFDSVDEDGVLVWGSTQRRAVLGHAVLHAAQSVLRLHGENGYLEKWVRHPFPVAALQDLRRLHLPHDTTGVHANMMRPPCRGMEISVTSGDTAGPAVGT
ncbi:hypothetical protein [Streptomyces sp. 184]|uniref:hypothetical protein n=1 Tax=Streptomyces sp. 184 TaxID=1827526 RepID=UPI0038918F39